MRAKRERSAEKAVLSPVEEWFRLTTRQRARNFTLAPADNNYPGPASPLLSSLPSEECAKMEELPAQHAYTPTQAHDPESSHVRKELQSLIKSYRKTDHSQSAASVSRHTPHSSKAKAEAPLTETRRELQSLIKSYRRTGDVGSNLTPGGKHDDVSSDDHVARGLNFDDVLQDSMQDSANPSESIFEAPATVRKPADALAGLSDMFADVSAVAERRMQRREEPRRKKSPRVQRASSEAGNEAAARASHVQESVEQRASLQESIKSTRSVANAAAVGNFSANMEVAGILFKELDELKQQLQYAREDFESDKNEPTSAQKDGKGYNAATVNYGAVRPGTSKRDESYDVAATSLESVTDRLEIVMRVVSNLMSLPSAAASSNWQGQDNNSPPSPGGQNPDHGSPSPILKPHQEQDFDKQVTSIY